VLRILWLSDRMIGGFSAYSKITFEVCTRLAKMGYQVAHVPMGRANRMGKWVYQGVLIYPSGDNPWGEDVALNHYVDWKADLLITLKDPWVFSHIHLYAVNFTPICPIDHSPVSPSITSRLHTAFRILVPTRFAQRELTQAGFGEKTRYVPHGVDCSVYRPLDKSKCKKIWFFNPDEFVVGIVAMNRVRKQIPRMLRGYRRFCVVPGIRIRTNDDFKPIETITEGDKVLTHEGRFEPVLEVVKRHYNGPIVKILLSLNNQPVVLTPEHKVLAIKTVKNLKCHKFCTPTCKKQVGCLRPYFRKEDGTVVRYVSHCKRRYFEGYKLEWIKAGELEKYDVVVYPRVTSTKDVAVLPLPKANRRTNRKYPETYAEIAQKLGVTKATVYSAIRRERMGKQIRSENGRRVIEYFRAKGYPLERDLHEIPLTPELMRFFGYYLAEGNSGYNKVVFTFNKKEHEYINDVLRIAKQIFGLDGFVSDYEYKPNAVQIVFNSKQLYILFQELFGRKHSARTKKIPRWFMELPDQKLIELIKGWWRGDGTSGYASIAASTASPTLAVQMRDVLLRLGCVASLRTAKAGKIYVLTVSGEHLDRLSRLLGITHPFLKQRRTTFQKFWLDDKYLYIPIRRIKYEEYNGTVYNLEVNEDETYVCEQMVVHNCELNPDVKSHLMLWTDVKADAEAYEGAVSMGVADVSVNLLPEIMQLGLGEAVRWPSMDEIKMMGGLPDWAGEDSQCMVTLYNSFDVLLLCSGGEGFGMPLVEAQAVGTPVITTDYAGGPEQVGAGLTVPAVDYVIDNTPGVRRALADVDKMAEALTRIMNADREKLARKARRFAERFDWSLIMERYFKPFLEECEVELKPLISKDGVRAWD